MGEFVSKQITRYQALAGLAITVLGALAFDSLRDFKQRIGAIQEELGDLSKAREELRNSMIALRTESETLRALNQKATTSVEATSAAADAVSRRRERLDEEFRLFALSIEARTKQLTGLVGALDSTKTQATEAAKAIGDLALVIPKVEATQLQEIAKATTAIDGKALTGVREALEQLQPIVAAPELAPEELVSLAASLGTLSTESERLRACIRPLSTFSSPSGDPSVTLVQTTEAGLP